MRTVALNFPKSILIETSNVCQGECKFCPYKKIRVGENSIYLDFDRYKKMIDEISEYPIVRLTLFNNNEPLLDRRICEFIQYAYKKLPNVEITLSTNGRILTLEKIYELKEAGLTTLYVSIPTVDDENYEKVMGINPKRIIDLLTGIDDPELFKMIRIAVPITKYHNHELISSKLSKYIICEWGLEYKENWEIDDTFLSISDFSEYEGPCDRPMDQMVISSNGDVIICCRDWHSQNVVGNVYDDDLYTIWHGDKMKEIQSYISGQKYDAIDCCKDCTMNKNYYLKRVRKI